MHRKVVTGLPGAWWAAVGRRAGVCLALLAWVGESAGCAHHPAARPAAAVPADESLYPAQGPAAPAYAIPDGAPEGVVYVMNLGLEQLEGAARGWYLHLRLAAQNDRGGVPWTIEPRDQAVIYGRQGQRIPASFAEGSGKASPLTLAAGARGHVDLWFPIVADADLGQVSLHWRVRRETELLAERQTTFERAPQVGSQIVRYRAVPYSHVHLAFGPGWWWGPYYGWGWGAGLYAGLWDPYWGWGWGWGVPYWRGWGYWVPRYWSDGGARFAPGIGGGFGGGVRGGPMGGPHGGGSGGRGISRGFGGRR